MMGGHDGKDEFVFCGACGTRLGADVRFCTSCGASQAQFAEGEPESVDGDVSPVGEETGGDAQANAPTEAMPASASSQPAIGGQEPPPSPPPPDAPAGAFAALAGAGGQGPPPPPPASSAAPGARPGGQRPFLESLFDIKFEHLITPKLVRFFYALSIVLLGVGTLVMIIAGFAADETSGVILLFLAPLSALFYLIMIRLWLELIVVAFKIRDGVERVAENTERPDG